MSYISKTEPVSVGKREGTTARRWRVVIAEGDPRQREQIRQTLYDMGLDIAGLASDGQEAVQMAAMLAPDFVLLDESLSVVSAMDAAYAIHAAAPETAAILMSGRDAAGQLRDAMQAGIRDIVAKPLVAYDLLGSFQRLDGIRRAQDANAMRAMMDPARLPRVFCVTGGKGGVGKTMLASNLALALRAGGDKTVLVDLYTQFGDVAAALNMKPERTLAELSSVVDDIDAALLSSYVNVHASGLHVLIGADQPLPLDAISVACLDRVISVLKREYRYIVFDTPPYLHATTLHAISSATAVMLVCNLFDYTTIADTKQLFDTLEGAYVSRDRLRLVVNRVNAQNRFQMNDIEKTFGQSVFAQVPNDPKVVALLNTGYPSHEAIARTPFGEAVGVLRDKLVNPLEQYVAPLTGAAAARKTRTFGFLGGLKSLMNGA